MDTKVHLSTKSATELADGASTATWILKHPLTPPNDNYKMHIQLADVSLPNTFDRISVARGTGTATWVYETYNGGTPTEPINVQSAINESRMVQVKLKEGHFTGGREAFLTLYGHAHKEAFDEFTDMAALNKVKLVPSLAIADPSFCTTFVLYKITGNQTSNSQQILFGDDDTIKLAKRDDKESYYVRWKLLTEHDIRGVDSITKSEVALAHALGFSRTEYGPELIPIDEATEKYTDFRYPGKLPNEVRDIVRATRAVDTLGTSYIKVITSLNVKHVDPNSLELRRVLGVFPVVDEGSISQTIQYYGNLQSPILYPIGDRKLDRITIQLLDDRDEPLPMRHDWYMAIMVSMKVPEPIERYTSTKEITGPIIDFHASGDPGMYKRAMNQMQDRVSMAEKQEMLSSERHNKRRRH